MSQQYKKEKMSLGHVDLLGFIDRMHICARDFVCAWMRWCTTYADHFKFSALRLPPPVRGSQTLVHALVHTQQGPIYTCPTLVHTSNNWHHRRYWKVPWVLVLQWKDQPGQHDLRQHQPPTLLVVLLVLGRDMRQYQLHMSTCLVTWTSPVFCYLSNLWEVTQVVLNFVRQILICAV